MPLVPRERGDGHPGSRIAGHADQAHDARRDGYEEESENRDHPGGHHSQKRYLEETEDVRNEGEKNNDDRDTEERPLHGQVAVGTGRVFGGRRGNRSAKLRHAQLEGSDHRGNGANQRHDACHGDGPRADIADVACP